MKVLNTYMRERIYFLVVFVGKKGTGICTDRFIPRGKKWNFLYTQTSDNKWYPSSQLLHIPQGNQIYRGTRGKASSSNENFCKISFPTMCRADDCLQLHLTNQKTLEWTANYAFDSSEYKPNADVNMSTSPKLLWNPVPNRANILMLCMTKSKWMGQHRKSWSALLQLPSSSFILGRLKRST